MGDDWPNYRQRSRKWGLLYVVPHTQGYCRYQPPLAEVALAGFLDCESLAIESWWGRLGSPSMTKRWLLTSLPRLPIRSHLIGQTHPLILVLFHSHPPSLPSPVCFLSFLFSSICLFLPSSSSSFSRFETCTRAGTCGDRAASREFNNCRSSRSRVNAMPRAHSRFTSASIFLVYVYIHGQGLLHLFQVKRTIAHSFADWDSENYDAMLRSSLKISSRNLIVKIGEKCRD